MKGRKRDLGGLGLARVYLATLIHLRFCLGSQHHVSCGDHLWCHHRGALGEGQPHTALGLPPYPALGTHATLEMLKLRDWADRSISPVWTCVNTVPSWPDSSWQTWNWAHGSMAANSGRVRLHLRTLAYGVCRALRCVGRQRSE